MSLISVITVNYHQDQATKELLESLNKYYALANIEIILVDNGAKTDKAADFQQYHKAVKYIRSEKNLGFAGGNNLGIAAAQGDYLFLINNDTEVTPGLIERLSASLDANDQIGIISPQINYYDEPGIIQYAGFTPMNYYTCRNACIGQFEPDQGQYRGLLQPTGFIHGAAMMLRRAALEKAGPMAENFFLYYEEMDWCERIKEAGYEIWLDTHALIYHKESLAVGKNSALKEFFMNRNRILFIRRNAKLHQRLFFYGYFAVLVMPRNIIQYLKGNTPGFIRVLFSAVFWNITHKKSSMDLGYTLK